MITYRFDPSSIETTLTGLNEKQCLVFGALITERLLPNYVAFHKETGWGDIKVLRDGLDLIWDYILGQPLPHKQIDLLLLSCDKVIPDTEDFQTILVSSALDAGTVVFSLLEFIKEQNVNNIATIATLAIETIDMHVQSSGLVPSNDPNLENLIETHPFMQREIFQQKIELDAIKNIPVFNAEIVAKLKEYWKNNGKSNIDL